MSVASPQKHAEVVRQVGSTVDQILKDWTSVQESWQPSDILPSMESADWQGAVEQFRKQAAGIPDSVLVVLVGNTVTEEALPSYQSMINRHPGVIDETGASDAPWGRWSRSWTAEENRHGDLLTRYLYLSGRIQMRAFEVTVQNLIRNGFNPGTGNDPYKGLIYTSFQERATKISHGNTALLANRSGDPTLGKVCALITGDESRHEEAYKQMVKAIIEIDPADGVIAFEQIMKTTVVMPAKLMSDDGSLGLFDRFAAVAQKAGVYTMRDYADIIEHLVGFWNVSSLTGLTGDAARAQDYLGDLAQRYRSLAEKAQSRLSKQPESQFSWIFNRSA